MQNPSHNNVDDKFGMNFGGFDPELFSGPHMGGPMGGMGIGMKRSAHDAGLDREPLGLSSDDDSDLLKKDDKMHPSSSNRDAVLSHQTNLESQSQPSKPSLLPNGKKTKGRVKIKMEFIDNKLRRYTTFSKRKTGIMKKVNRDHLFYYYYTFVSRSLSLSPLLLLAEAGPALSVTISYGILPWSQIAASEFLAANLCRPCHSFIDARDWGNGAACCCELQILLLD